MEIFGGGLQFVHRGSITGYDLTNPTTDGQWHTWNLSPIVPVGAQLVTVAIQMADDLCGQYVVLQATGYESNVEGWQDYTQVAGRAQFHVWTIPLVNQSIRYLFSNTTWTTTRLTVLGWWI